MKLERLKHLIKHIGNLKVDTENGVILNRTGISGTKKYFTITVHYKAYYIHEVIVVAAGLNPLNMTIDHKDGDRYNNRLDNLEIVTLKENIKRGRANGLITSPGRPKIAVEKREQIRKEYATGKFSMRDLKDKHGITTATIHKIIHE